MDDVAPKLLEILQADFHHKFDESKVVAELAKKLASQAADYKDANAFAVEIGKILAGVYQENLSSDVLPDGRMYYNIAKRIIEPTMKENYELVSAFSQDVQTALNHKAKIGIKGIKAPLKEDKIRGIVERLAEEEDFDAAKWLLDEPVVTFTQSVVNDTIEENTKFAYKAGLKPKIVRTEVGSCCEWCKEVAGTYEYPKVPKDVYRRHNRCRCTVEYFPGDGKKQDVHSKKWVDIEKDEKKKRRKEFNKDSHSTLNAHTIRKLEEKNWTPEFKAKALQFYRETSKAGVEFSDHGVSRALDRAINKNEYTIQDIIKLAKSKPLYLQTEDGRVVHSDGVIHLLKNPNTGDIISVSDRKKPRKDWVIIDEKNKKDH